MPPRSRSTKFCRFLGVVIGEVEDAESSFVASSEIESVERGRRCLPDIIESEKATESRKLGAITGNIGVSPAVDE